MKRCLIPVLFLLLCGSAFAQVTFQWDPYTPATDIDGFKLYQGTATGVYGASAVATVTPGTATTFTLPRPSPGIYFWVLRAYKGALESGNSNEVTATVKPQTPTTLKITANVATNVGRKNATLTAQTTVPATTTLSYSIGGAWYAVAVDSGGLEHRITLSNLRPHTSYRYRWSAVTTEGATDATEIASFTTQ